MEIILLILALGVGISAGLLLRPKFTPYQNGTGPESQDQESSRIFMSAIKKAQVIVSRAEAEAVRVVAQSKFTTEKLEEKYQEELEARLADIQVDFSGKMGLAIKAFQDHLGTISSQSRETQTQAASITQEQTRQIYERFEKSLAEFMAQTQEKSVTSIQTELAAARQLIDTYKQQQMALIDENILAMLEKTLSIVLTKKLSLKDQLDIVYDALEKAKAEKLII